LESSDDYSLPTISYNQECHTTIIKDEFEINGEPCGEIEVAIFDGFDKFF